MLDFDHLFVFVEPARPQADALRRAGFTVRFQREHPGQGTRNELLLFPDHYLELLWLCDRAEAEQTIVRLDQRADWARTGASPFGVALRGPKDSAPDVDWVLYTLPGFSSGLWIDRRTLDDPSLPLVFVFDRPQDVAGGPRDGGYPREFLHHDCGATGIARIVLYGPGLDQTPSLPLPPNIELRPAETPLAKVELENAAIPQTKIGPLLELVAGPG